MHHQGLDTAQYHQSTVAAQQGCSRQLLDLSPYLMRAKRQGRVMLSFADGKTGDARVAMGRSTAVWRRESIDAKHAISALGELVGGGASHGAKAEHDRVDALHEIKGARLDFLTFSPVVESRKKSSLAPFIRKIGSITGSSHRSPRTP